MDQVLMTSRFKSLDIYQAVKNKWPIVADVQIVWHLRQFYYSGN